jgi:hypothetical protein
MKTKTLQQIYNNITFQDVTLVFKFFTYWVILLIILHKLVYKYIDIVFLATIIFVMGLYISHINPKKYTLHLLAGKIEVDGWFKFLTADVSHFLIFVLALTMYGTYYRKNHNDWTPLIGSLCLIVFYAVFFQPDKVYDVSRHELLIILILTTIVYKVLLKINIKSC